ncbi:hypothetical protein ACOSP7_028570 [Xanthoceras sorbifolium]
MSSPSNLRRHKAGTGGPSNKEDRNEAAVAHQREVTESSILGRTEVWGDQRESAKTACLAQIGLLEAEGNEAEIKRFGKELRDDWKELETVRQELVARAKREELMS